MRSSLAKNMNTKTKRIFAASAGLAALLCTSIFLASMPSRTLLEEIGTIESSKIGASLTFKNSDPSVIIERRISGFDWGIVKYGMTTSVSPQSWKNHPGFFAFVDVDGRFWVYNGKDQTLIYERMPDGGGRTWGLQTWKGPVPPEFSSRIPYDSQARGYSTKE
jgi:hypothetical protein